MLAHAERPSLNDEEVNPMMKPHPDGTPPTFMDVALRVLALLQI